MRGDPDATEIESGTGSSSMPAASATVSCGASAAGATVTTSATITSASTGAAGTATTPKTASLPGLGPQTPRNVQLQKGEERVDSGPARGSGQPPDGEKLGRNDLCPCGSSKRFKKCCLRKGRF